MLSDYEKELTVRALWMYRNWLETGNPITSAIDVQNSKMGKLKALSDEQLRLCLKLTEISGRIQRLDS